MNQNRVKDFLVKYRSLIVLGLYVLVHVLIILRHEHWRDEGQAWMIAGVPSLKEMALAMPSEGHPILWYLVLRVAQFAGLRYQYASLLSLLFMTIAAYILLRLDISFGLKCAVLCSPAFLYFNVALFRPYSIIVLELILICYWFRDRTKKRFRWTILVFFLPQTHIYMLGLSLALCLVMVGDALVEKDLKRKLSGCALSLVGFASLFLAIAEICLAPNSSDQHLGLGALIKGIVQNPFAAIRNMVTEVIALLRKSFWINENWSLYSDVMAYLVLVMVGVIIVLGFAGFRKKWRELLCFLGGTGAIAVILLRYGGQHWQHGLVFWEMVLMAAYLVAQGKFGEGRKPWRISFGMGLFCACTALTPMAIYAYDWGHSFSNAGKMAEYMNHNFDIATVFVIVQDSDYYPNLKAYLDDDIYVIRAWDEQEYDYFDRQINKSVDWQTYMEFNQDEAIYYLSTTPLEVGTLVYAAEENSLWDENFYLYK